jgi:hypothetical protein
VLPSIRFGFVSRLYSRKKNRQGRLQRSPRKARGDEPRAIERREQLTANLVVAYNFDEGAGAVLHDLSGNGQQRLPHRRHLATVGRFGGALSFNGASDSFVTVKDSSSPDLPTGMPLEAWVDPSTLNSLDQRWAAAKRRSAPLLIEVMVEPKNITPGDGA